MTSFSVETTAVCEVCGEFVHDEFTNLSCGCGPYFAYTVVGEMSVWPDAPKLVRPILPDD